MTIWGISYSFTLPKIPKKTNDPKANFRVIFIGKRYVIIVEPFQF